MQRLEQTETPPTMTAAGRSGPLDSPLVSRLPRMTPARHATTMPMATASITSKVRPFTAKENGGRAVQWRKGQLYATRDVRGLRRCGFPQGADC